MEEQQDEYIAILEKLKNGLDRVKDDVHEEFSIIKKDINIQIKKHFLASLEIIKKLTIAAEMKDEATASHIKRIGIYCKFIGQELCLDDDLIERLFYACPLHDIGKIGIPDSILLKKDRLTAEEFKIAQTHSQLGYEILKDSEFPIIEMASIIALTHHERWDGKGYPNGLAGEDIPLDGRITLLADQYDSLRSVRPYKQDMTHEKAMDILLNGDNKTDPSFIDPQLLQIFKSHHRKFNRIFEDNC